MSLRFTSMVWGIASGCTYRGVSSALDRVDAPVVAEFGADGRAPGEPKVPTGQAWDSDLHGMYARFLGERSGDYVGETFESSSDLDGDGYTDLVLGGRDWVRMYRGPFSSGVYSIDEFDAEIANVPSLLGGIRPAGDTNHDGRDDLWVGGALMESPFFVNDDRNRATAAFNACFGCSIESRFDADGDGEFDLVYGSSAFWLAYGPLSGPLSYSGVPAGWPDQSQYLAGQMQGGPAASKRLGDVNGDGEIDFLLLDSTEHLWVTTPAARGTAEATTLVVAYGDFRDVLVGDVDGDEIVDLIDPPFLCAFDQVLSGGRTWDCPTVSQGTPLAVVDLDGDGVDDILVSPVGGGYGMVWGGALDQPATPVSLPFLTGPQPLSFERGDLTGDGLVDLLFPHLGTTAPDQPEPTAGEVAVFGFGQL